MGDKIKAGSGIELDLIELPDMPELNDDEEDLNQNFVNQNTLNKTTFNQNFENKKTVKQNFESQSTVSQSTVYESTVSESTVSESTISKSSVTESAVDQNKYTHLRPSNIFEELDKKMKSGRFLHTFKGQIEEINKVVSMKYSSTHDIASVIIKDVALASKVLSIVNSCYYGLLTHQGISNKGISNISDAVAILGTKEVQQTAATIMLFEFMRDIAKSEPLKEKSLASLMRGMMAKEIAQVANYNSADDFQIAAMLYDIGEQIILFCEPQAYHQIYLISEQKEVNKEEVARKLIGNSFAEIGQRIVSTWGFPTSIVDSLQPFKEFRIEPNLLTIQSIKRLVASFTNEMSNIDWRVSKILRQKQLEMILRRYGRFLDFGVSDANLLLNNTIKKVEKHAKVLRVNLKNSRFDRQKGEFAPIDLVRGALNSGALNSGSGVLNSGVLNRGAVNSDALNSDDLNNTAVVSVQDRQNYLNNNIQWIENQIKKIENALSFNFKLSEILHLIITTMYKGFFFSRIGICIVNKANGIMAVRFVLGDESDQFSKNFSFVVSTDSDDIFNKAMSTGLEIVVEDVRDKAFNSKIPTWYIQGNFARSFAIYPIVIEQKKIGLIYVDWNSNAPDIFSDQVKYLMQKLKNLTLIAIKKSKTWGK